MSKVGRKMSKIIVLLICVKFLHEMSKNNLIFVLYFGGLCTYFIANVSGDSEKLTTLFKVTAFHLTK